MLQRYSSAMATIQIRNVPDDVHRTFQSRAALAGQSLQEYLLGRLVEEARRPTMAEIMDEVERDLELHPEWFTTESAVDIIRELRESE